jgi:predicted HTH transcriptional regulator
MTYLTFIFIVLIFIAVGIFWFMKKRINELKKEIARINEEKIEIEKIGDGLTEYYNRLRERKEKIKTEIIEIIKEKSKISRSEIIEKMKISTTSAVRYFDELEQENKIKQIGKTGKNTHYTLTR